MTYAERVPHPSVALGSAPVAKRGGLTLGLIFGLVVLAFFAMAILKPEWLRKLGVEVSTGASGLLENVNPLGWR